MLENNQSIFGFSSKRYDWALAFPTILSVFLVFISFHNFLLFHTLAELFTIGVAILVFLVAWQTYPFSRNNFLMFLACGYFWIGGLDLVHALVYKGMNVFPITGSNPPTQFWIIARYLEAALLLIAPVFLKRAIKSEIAFLAFGIGSVAMYFLIMSGNFPDAFIEGEGLTPFKIISEYIIIAILAVAILHMCRNRDSLKPNIFKFLVFSIILTMGAELAFTFYVSLYGLSNMVGHILKLFSYWLIFMAIIRSTLREPYIDLEHKIEERTKDLTLEIDERRKVEADLRVAKDQALSASNTKSEFLASMSHELRTPLNAIIGFSDTMRTEAFGPIENKKYLEYLNDIHYSGDHLLKLINDILDVSAIEIGKLELYEEDVNVGDTVKQCIKMIMPRAERRDITISIKIQEDLPKLYADKRRLEEILLNFLSNAAKFSHEHGEIILEAHVDDKGCMVLSVADEGIGMSETDLIKAMEPFRQVDGAYARKFEGTGLGLPLSKSLAEIHGAVFSIKSKSEKGTKVSVRFPAKRTIAR